MKSSTARTPRLARSSTVNHRRGFMKKFKASNYKRITAVLLVLSIAAIGFSSVMIQRARASILSTLISSNFEVGDTTVWLFANPAGTTANQWVINSATNNGGTRSAYITNNSATVPPPNTYTNTSITSAHIYTSVTFPAGETAAVLTFDWKALGEHTSTANWDYLRVSISATAPTSGTLPSAASQLPVSYNAQSSFVNASVNIPASLATGTKFIIFTWHNDSSGGTNPPAAIDNVSLVSQTPSPLTGTKTIGSGGDYPNFNSAIANLNANGVGAGGVTFNIAAGSTFNETPPPIAASGTLANPIIFQKSGVGANPKITAMGTGNYGPTQTTVASSHSAVGDAVITIAGGDFITFDGIDVASADYATGTTAIEYGYLVRNASVSDGAQNNTIKNTAVTLNRTNTSGNGIFQNATTTSGGFVPTNATGANSNNKYYNLTIGNAQNGVLLAGNSSFPDLNTEVGTISGGATTIGSSTNPIGGSGNTSAGIRATSQSNVKIFNTEVQFVSTTASATTATGIWVESGQGASNEVKNNKIHDISTTSTATTALLYGLRIEINSGNTASVFNNMIYTFSHGITTASATQVGRGIAVNVGGNTGTVNVYFNSVRMQLGTAASSTAFYMNTGTTVTRNNAFTNFTASQTTAKHYAYFQNAGTITSSHNILYISSGTGASTNGFTGFSAATDRITLTNWQTATGQDANSLATNPEFVSATDLHISGTSPAIDAGTTIPAITDDIDGQTRPIAAAPDIGADEVAAVVSPGTLQFTNAALTGSEGATFALTVNRTSGSAGTVTADVSITGGTATGGPACTAGVDYITFASPTTLTFVGGDTSETINIMLCNDVASDPGETITFSLTNPTGGAIIGAINAATLTITDVPPPSQQFSSATYSGNEGTIGTITVTRTGDTSVASSVDYATVAGGTATGGASCTAGVDFGNTSGTLTFTSGQASQTFTVQLCSDTIAESSETVNLALTNPVGGILGTPNTATLTIADVASQFCNADGAITIPPTNAVPPFPSTPYPSNNVVSGLTGTVDTVRVTLYNFTHSFSDDVDILLVSPAGQKFILMSDAGGGPGLDAAATLTFSDTAAVTLPDSLAIATGSYKPTNYEAASDTFATGVPASPYSDPGPGGTPAGTATLNGTFGGANPNGTWQLFVSDDDNGDGGSIAGWCLEITTVDVAQPGTIKFNSAAYTGNEGTTAIITATRTSGSSGIVSVDYATVAGGTATGGAACTAGVDYIDTMGTLTWADMDSAPKTFTVTICSDATIDNSETVNLALSNVMGGATLGTPNTAVLTITDVPPPLSGTISVPGDYPSLTNTGGVFAALNSLSASGNVTINITASLTGETGANALNALPAGVNVTIKPTGAIRTITGTGANLIKLNGADNVTIDGSLTGGTDRSLTITTTSTSAAATVIWVASASASNGATNNTVKNCTLTGNSRTVTFAVIEQSSGTTLGAVAEAPNSNNTYQNNAISRALDGIDLVGAATGDMGNAIIGNDIGSTGATATRIGYDGIFIAQQVNAVIANNRIFGVTSSVDTVTTSGILVGGANNGVSIVANRISDIKHTHAGGYGANGILLNSSSAAANVFVYNNFIYDIAGNGYASGFEVADNGYGIVIMNGGGYGIYHNSINMNTNQAVAGNAAAINITSAVTTANGIDLRDNIFANTQTAGNTRYAIYSGAANTVFSMIDYNDYYTTGPNLGFIGSARTTLTDIQAGFGSNLNSKDVLPVFVSATDLHLQATSTLLGMGTVITGLTTDFDGDPRPAANPDIGADEVVQAVGGSIPAGTYYNAVAAGGDSLGGNVMITGQLTIQGKLNAGSNTLTIDCNGSISGASASNFILGNLEKRFCTPTLPQAFSYPLGTSPGGADQYTPLDVTVTALGVSPSSLTVKANDGVAPSSPPLNAAKTLQRYWTLTESGDLTANLVFNYLDSEVPGTASELNFRLIKIESGGTPNSFPPAQAPIDTTMNRASINGVMNFSEWTMAEPDAPTSIEANVGGRILTSGGQPLSGVQMNLLDTMLGQQRTVMTDANGDYQFGSVLTGRDILVTPQRQGYTFTPQNQVFSHTGERLNVNFMATPDTTQTRAVFNDYDGDGKTDLSVFRPSDASWYILPSSTGVMQSIQWGLATDRIVPADYDGDRKTDVAVFRPSTGEWHIYQSATQTVRSAQWGIAEDIVMPADFDGDGHADLTVFRPSTGTWYILESQSGLMRAVNWGTNGDRPVAADYDGDGRADIAVWRPSNGYWYIIKSSNGSYSYENWGLSTDRPVVGDYDADGKADIAVFRPDNSCWYIHLSGDGSISAKTHGTSADSLVPGDYDGDGKTDRAVWQPADGNWLILKTTTNAASGQQWGTNGDRPAPSAYVP